MNNIYIGTLLFLVGCYFSLTLEFALFKTVFFCLLLLCVGMAFLFRSRRKKRYILTTLVSLCFLLTGLWAGSNAPASPVQELQDYFEQEVLVYGSIEPMSVKRHEYGTSFILRCDELRIEKDSAERNISDFGKQLEVEEKSLRRKFNSQENDGKVLRVDYKQKLRVFTQSKEVPLSGKVWCRGKLLPLRSLRNPGSFDGERWNHLQGLGGRLAKAQIHLVSEESSLLDKFAVLNVRLRNFITTNVQGQAGAILSGMALGGSIGLDDATREVFAANGLAHLLSVSGTHMVLLAGFLFLILRPLPIKLRKVFILLVLFAYALLCGLRPPVVRALCMSAALFCGGSGAKRGNLLCLLAVVFLIYKPFWLWDIGFQLSFGAVAGLIWLYPKIKNYCCQYLPQVLGEAVAITVSAQLAVLPFLIAHFHQISFVSLLSNILLVPVLEVATILTLLSCFGTIFLFFLPSEFLLEIAGWLTQQILVQAELLANFSYSVLVIGSFPLWYGVIYYFAIILWADLPCVIFLRNNERKLFLLGASMCLFTCFLWKSFAPQPLKAYFLDVGQGDCAVVVTPARKVLVFDTGGLKNYDTGSKVLAPFLRSLGKSKIDLLLLSHMDYDHAGGVVGLARNIKIEKIILPTAESFSGKVFPFGETYVKILDAPQQNVPAGKDNSTVAEVRCGKHSLLFTGDIDAARERKLQNLEQYEVLKVAHHGSKHSSSQKFLEKVRPSVAVISVGAGNKYGHPHSATLERLASVGAKVLRTDELGAVQVVFDDTQIKCYSYVYNKSAF